MGALIPVASAAASWRPSLIDQQEPTVPAAVVLVVMVVLLLIIAEDQAKPTNGEETPP
jgi:hypothetical protein